MAYFGRCAVQSGSLYVRSDYSTSASIIYSLLRDEVVEILSPYTSANFYPVRRGPNAVVGWASADYLSILNDQGFTSTGTIRATGLRLRSGPGTSFTILRENLPNGASLRIYSTVGTWLLVMDTSASFCGWVDGSYVNITGGNSVYASVSETNSTLTQEQMTSNARYVLSYLMNNGFTKNAACGVLGNMQRESDVDPGVWQYLNDTTWGYGLVQWSPATKFLNRARDMGVISSATAAAANSLANSDAKRLMDAELEFLLSDCAVTSAPNWFYPQTSGYSRPKLSFADFKGSYLSAYDLAIAFHDHYERSSVPDLQTRGNYATAWFNLL